MKSSNEGGDGRTTTLRGGQLVPEDLKPDFELEGIETLEVTVEAEKPSVGQVLASAMRKSLKDIPTGIVTIGTWEFLAKPLILWAQPIVSQLHIH